MSPSLLFRPIFSFILLLSVAAEFETISLGNPFNDGPRSQLISLGNARIEKGSLQLTTDTSNSENFFVNNTGRIIYTKPYKIWEEYPDPTNSSRTSKRVFSFTSFFVFNIYHVHNKPVGEGLAFVIVPDSQSIPNNSYGEFLGLTNSAMDGNRNNQFVAVEFDTLKQPYDPDGNHVGLDINSVRSKAFRSLSDINVTLAPLQENGVNYSVWVEYSGLLGRIEVYFSEANKLKPDLPLLSATIDLSEYLAQESYFGFSGSTGLTFQLNCVLSWNLNVEILPNSAKKKTCSNPLKCGVLYWILIGVIVLLLGALLYFCISRWWWTARTGQAGTAEEGQAGTTEEGQAGTAEEGQAGTEQEMQARTLALPATPREYEYQVLMEATKNFHEDNLVGKGAYGRVYKGDIEGENHVAVKEFFGNSREQDSLDELTVINRLRHRNLVPLLGWCRMNETLLLVYKFMPNGSLEGHLFRRDVGQSLLWDIRKRILAGVAVALEYLHHGCDPSVLHRDLKANNILLDANFNARLGDFGLARVIESGRNSHVSEKVAGTRGYMAPEYWNTGKATRKSDVYAFGILVLEVVCGKRSGEDLGGTHSLSDWVGNLRVKDRILDGVDQSMGENYNREEAKRLLDLGLSCCNKDPRRRPSACEITVILRELCPDARDATSYMSAIAEASSQGENDDVETTPY